jgi:hypothetical protein
MDTFDFAMDNTSDDALPTEPTRSRRYTKVEWQAHRGTIVGMYPKKGVTIRELKEYMLREHSLSVTWVLPFAWPSSLTVTNRS